MLSPRFRPCVSVPARDRLFTADDLRCLALLLEGATFLAPRSFLAAAHRCSARHFLASRHSSGASGSTPAALSCRGRRPGQPGFPLRKIRMTSSVFYLLQLLIDFSWRACFFPHPVFLKNKKCNSNVSAHDDALFFPPSINVPLLPVAAKAAQKKNKDVFNLVGPNLLLEEDTVPGEVTHFWPL